MIKIKNDIKNNGIVLGFSHKSESNFINENVRWNILIDIKDVNKSLYKQLIQENTSIIFDPKTSRDILLFLRKISEKRIKTLLKLKVKDDPIKYSFEILGEKVDLSIGNPEHLIVRNLASFIKIIDISLVKNIKMIIEL